MRSVEIEISKFSRKMGERQLFFHAECNSYVTELPCSHYCLKTFFALFSLDNTTDNTLTKIFNTKVNSRLY